MPHLGILTSRSHPTLPYLLDELAAVPGLQLTLLFDAKDFSDKDRAIFADRTQGAFPPRDTAPLFARCACVDVPNHNDPQCLDLVRTRQIDLLLNGGTPRRVGPELLRAAARGVLNAHPGILPKYRGATCCEWAIHNDEPVGVTAHFMDEGLDSGPILFPRELPVRKGMDYSAVRVALYRHALKTAAEAVQAVFANDLSPAKLPPQPPGEAFKPIPDDLLAAVKRKLAAGEYKCAK